MSTSRKDKIEIINTASTTGAIDNSTRGILDVMQKQNENFNKQFELLTRRIEGTQRIADSENKRRAAEIELLGKHLSKIKIVHDATTELGSFITMDESIPARDKTPPPSAPIRPEADNHPSYEDCLPHFVSPSLRTKDAIACIPQLNGEDDIGVEEFIREVRKIFLSHRFILRIPPNPNGRRL